MSDSTRRRVKATWIGGPAFHDQEPLAYGDTIEVYEDEIASNPHLAPLITTKPDKAKTKPAPAGNDQET